ncbi:MAG: hypothetical protein O2960_23065 [Verrucomicrobia bacterium]|nr:hypothetical protein [Verrucomicrobiota bacterium]
MLKTLTLVCISFLSCVEVGSAEAKIIKVLPHLLDSEGRHSLSPSLFERDAYQAFLRENPSMQAAMRFDIHWKAKSLQGSPLLLRIELRTSGSDPRKPTVLEASVEPSRWFANWTTLRLEHEAFQKLGKIVAWRATLWEGSRQLEELKSFLW